MTALPELVVLDLAGTTVRDAGEVPAAFAAALGRAGIAIDAGALRAVRGASKREAIAALLPAGPDREARASRLFDDFRSDLLARYAATAAAIPGAEATVAWLRERRVRVALDTGFDRETTLALLAALGWREGFADAVVCGDDVPRGRPAPDLLFAAMERCGVTRVERVAAVGDTLRDLAAGHAAGVRWNVGVLSGAHDRATLAAAPHSHLLPSVADLPGLFAGAA